MPSTLVAALCFSEIYQPVCPGSLTCYAKLPPAFHSMLFTSCDAAEISSIYYSVGLVFQIGDECDARDLRCGAWFESKVKRITKEKADAPESNGEQSSVASSTASVVASSSAASTDTIHYHVLFDG